MNFERSLSAVRTNVQDFQVFQTIQKKDKNTKEAIEQLVRKIKTLEQRGVVENQIVIELKKRHKQLTAKVQLLEKEKADLNKTLKQLYALFQKQRAALEISIKKTKSKDTEIEQQQQQLQERQLQIIQLNQKIDQHLNQKENDSQRFQEQLQILRDELQQRKLSQARIQHEANEISQSNIGLKDRLSEYESKIKHLIKELEDESKRHINEVNQIHDQYRVHKARVSELELRVENYKKETGEAEQAHRIAKKELIQYTFKYDELEERHFYLEAKYNTLVKRMGVSQEDLNAVEQQINIKDHKQIITSEQRIESKQQQFSNNLSSALQDRREGVSGLKNKVIKPDQSVEILNEVVLDDIEHYAMITKGPSQRYSGKQDKHHGNQSYPEGIVDSYAIYGENPDDEDEEDEDEYDEDDHRQKNYNGMQNQNNPRSIHQMGSDQPLDLISIISSKAMTPPSSQQVHYSEQQNDHYQHKGQSESNDMFNNLFMKLSTSQALQNHYIREKFNLDLIHDEEDLHNYNNLLNALAAIFYSSHQMKQQTNKFFNFWVQAFQNKISQKELQRNSGMRMNKIQIQIDTEIANAKYDENQNFDIQNYANELHANEVDLLDHQDILVEEMGIGLDSQNSNEELAENGINFNDEDAVHDFKIRKFLADMQKVGPFSKQILNYSYPPLLYQRGDDSEEEEIDEEGIGEDDIEDEELSHNQFPLDDDFNVENLLGRELGGHESDIDNINADLRQQNSDERIEEVMKGLFGQDSGRHQYGAAASPGGIDQVDVSDIQKMIERSGTEGSPELDQFNREMINKMAGNNKIRLGLDLNKLGRF